MSLDIELNVCRKYVDEDRVQRCAEILYKRFRPKFVSAYELCKSFEEEAGNESEEDLKDCVAFVLGMELGIQQLVDKESNIVSELLSEYYAKLMKLYTSNKGKN